MRIVVTGKSGQVVTALIERGALASVDIIPLGRPEFDLANVGAIAAALTSTRPDVIVSAAAYTAVDKAESEPELAFAVNAEAPRAIAAAAAQLGVPVVHLSTDYVFDGAKPTPYFEDDATGPLGVYGKSKLAGEAAVRSTAVDHAILRTAWVYSPFGNNFLKTMLRVAKDRPVLRVVDDQNGTPTSALDIADAILAISRNMTARPDDQGLRGTFHLVGTGEASWADFATEIFARSAALSGPAAVVERITTAEYPTPAPRPANSRLATDKLFAAHGVRLPAWQVSTGDVVRRLVGV